MVIECRRTKWGLCASFLAIVEQKYLFYTGKIRFSDPLFGNYQTEFAHTFRLSRERPWLSNAVEKIKGLCASLLAIVEHKDFLYG